MANPYVASTPYVSVAATDQYAKLRRISITPTDNLADGASFGNPGLEIPSSATWTVELEWPQAFDTAEIWNVWSALEHTSVAFIVSPASGVASVTNPTCTFNAYMPALPFIDAGVGESTIASIRMTTIGAPVFATS